MKLSVVIPCYNEEKNIPLIVDRLKSLNLDKSLFEFILVNNGSTDNSQQIIEEQIKDIDYISTFHVVKNQGYGFGIISGLKVATGDFLGWTHADMQTDPKDLITAYDILKENNFSNDIFVKGDRKGRPFVDQFFTTGMSIFETFYMKAPLRDINAQPNIFSRKLFESWDNPPHDFSLDLFALYCAHKKNQKIIRFPVLFPERIHGESHWNTSLKNKWKFIKRTLDFSFELKKRLK